MKARVGPRVSLYPMPTVLVGALVGGKPNYITVAHVGIADLTSISLSLAKVHHTNKGIKENGTFSVNIPSTELVKETDHCGLVSGADEDKSRLFDTFFGKLKTAPMIQECPLNMECHVTDILDYDPNEGIIGRVVKSYANADLVTDDKVDMQKARLIVWTIGGDFAYYRLGEQIEEE